MSDNVVMDEMALRTAVDAAFERVAAGLGCWPDPHAGQLPDDDEYSRVTNATKWLIVGGRCDAWIDALVGTGLAAIERDASVRWETPPSAGLSRLDRIIPKAAGALDLVVARGRIGDVVDAGVTIGVGDPAVDLVSIPDCGCDACDSGSKAEIEQVDQWMAGIVFGLFRRLSKGDRQITVVGPDGWRASGMRRRDNPKKVIADPTGWSEVSGPSWLKM